MTNDTERISELLRVIKHDADQDVVYAGDIAELTALVTPLLANPLGLPLRPVALIWDAPTAVTEPRYGIAMGWYVDCDSAVCRDCAPRGFGSGDYSEWPGFEGWESPLAICYDNESDSVTHCRQCGAVIAHDLTPDGAEAVKDAVAELISEPGSHTADVVAQWWEAYAGTALDDKDYADVLEYAGISLRDVIENLMVAAGCRKYIPGQQAEPDTLPGT